MKPFLKWVGSKRKLVDVLNQHLPNDFNRYFEPFLGSGSLYFYLELDNPCFLGDSNVELITTYAQVRKNPAKLHELCSKFPNNPVFHKKISELDRNPEKFYTLSPVFRASRVMYLVRTSFNGLWRVNSKNQFNTPYVKNTNTIFPEETYQCSKLLKTNSFLTFGDYKKTIISAARNDFVYLDPPYHPVSKTSNFTSYTSSYNEMFQTELLMQCKMLDLLGVKFLQSNSYCPEILNLYKDFSIVEIEANRNINCDATKRGKVKEVLIKNY